MTSSETMMARVSTLEAALAAERQTVATLTAERDRLRAAHERLRLELEMLKRRIYVAKAERVDTAQLELEFAQKLAVLDQLAGLTLPERQQKARRPRRPTGRRRLRDLALPQEHIELRDPALDEDLRHGEVEEIGREVSNQVVRKRGGMRVLVVTRIKYGKKKKREATEIYTTPMPPQTFPRCIAAPSLLAHVIVQKHGDGMPLYRLERRFAEEGFPVARGLMSRWLEDAGATFGATIVAAAKRDALATAFCLATDATGVLVQPEPRADRKRQPCRRGHYFVTIADRDHIFFDYTAKENSATVQELFAGFSGYLQADAKSVYDALFRPPDEEPPDGGGPPREVGCWSHARRKFWEATAAKSVVAREGLARIGRLFEVDEQFRGEPPERRKVLRDAHLRPHLEKFFEWAKPEYEAMRHQRGLLCSALGYVERQREPLLRVLEDGRLLLDNNRSERELRVIAVGRKAWLFVGSDDHGLAAGHLFTMIASARLHGLDPETYIRDIIRILGAWPKDRYLELAPKYWAATRARLDPTELEAEVGYLKIPPPLPDPPRAPPLA